MKKFVAKIVALPICLAMVFNCNIYTSHNVFSKSCAASDINQADTNGKEETSAPQLLKDASVETSAISFWEHNDTSTEYCLLFDKDKEQEIVDYMNGIQLGTAVKDVDINQLKGSMYSMEIGRKEGTSANFTWYDGYVFLNDGSVYEADIDFEKMKNYQWESKGTMPLTSFPNIRHIALQDGKWNTKFLEKGKINKKSSLKITKATLKGTKLKVTLKNKTKQEAAYSEYFSIQAKIDDSWYAIPAETEIAFIDIAHIVKAGGKSKKTFDLASYGELPSGTYRIVVEGTSAKFTIS